MTKLTEDDKKKILGILALLGSTFIGGAISPFAVKILRQELGPLSIIFGRFLIASIIFIPFIKLPKLSFSEMAKLLLVTSFAFANIALFAWGIKFTTGIASQIIYITSVVFVILGGWIFLSEKITHRQIIGTILAIFGVTILILKSREQNSEIIASLGSFKGNLIILVASLFWASYLVMSRRLSNKINQTIITSNILLFSLLFSLPLMLVEEKLQIDWVLKLNLVQILAFAAIGIFSSVLFFFLTQFALKQLKAFYVSFFGSFFGPFFTAAVGMLFFGEKLTPYLLIGFFLILSGSWLVSFQQLKNLRR